MAAAGWPEVADELVGALAALRPEAAISLSGGDGFVQFIRFTRGYRLDVPSVYMLTRDVPERAADLAALGWQPDEDGTETLCFPEVPAPVEPATARRLADVIVRTLRDVHGFADPAEVTYTSFDNNGMRAPRLRTVAAEAGQEAPDDRDPATLLPAPSPAWRRLCAVFAGGLGDWSRGAFDRLVAEQGWQPDGDELLAAGGERIEAHDWDAGYYGHGEISSLSARLPVGEAGVADDFRRALAGAVAVLGHPPIVGSEGRMPLARWRGEDTTLTLEALWGRHIRLTAEPTGPRENVIYNKQKWMMTPDDWAPDELWFTEPDVEAPQAKALHGMMTYWHSPSETLDGTVDELRALFASWCSALPMLHPYASSARWRLRRTSGTMVAEGEFTRERVTARFGWSDEFGERVETVPGGDVAADLAARVAAALDRAGVTAPGDLDGGAWSDTPAERLNALRLTVRR
ncbi:hypothetical protein [Dactylosporangium sp. NPDC050588]|uniref:TY-Chap domain-containing protein n=1 Tax=Dactylosporangium sp. NPDC050588 TaxID=3157211 RepID=UPI0033D8E718